MAAPPPLKVLLLNPPYRKRGRGFNREGRCTQEAGFWSTPWPPYSLASIAAVLRQGGRAVEVRDCPALGIGEDRLKKIVEDGRYGLIVAAVSTETIDGDLRVLAALKERTKARIAIFGIHATVFGEEIIRANAAIDAVVLAEPEATAGELAAAIESGRPPGEIAGIVFRDAQDGEPARTPPRSFIADLDALPFPAWDLIDLSRYRLPIVGRNFIMINTLRGCPYRCSFCNSRAYYGSTARCRSVPSLIAEIRHHIATVGARDIFFWGDTFTLRREQVRALCEALIAEEISIRWVANSRVDTVDPEILALMSRAGCWMVSFGIESGDEDILRSCDKNITLERISRAVRDARAAGLLTAGHFIFGLPGETASSARRTSRFARRLGLDFAAFYTAVPFPGSPLYEQARAAGWLRDGDWTRFNQTEAVMDLPTMSRVQVEAARRRARRAFDLHPRRLRAAFALIKLRRSFGLLRGNGKP
jgi:anaerobic magnesium-protoporphyrin IX monomethyl ester cyclase